MLTIATWNIHAGIGRDRRHDLARIWRVIELIDADILGLQEVVLTDPEHDLLLQWARKAGYSTHFICTRAGDKPDTFFGNLLLSRLPMTGQPSIDVSVPGREQRHVLCAEVQHQQTPIAVWVTHLGLKRSERRDQIGRIHAQHAYQRPQNCILMGDFNEWWPGPSALNRLSPTFRKLNTPASFPAHRPFMALDRIFIAGNIDLVDSDAVDHPLYLSASDHRPIEAKIALAVLDDLG